MLFFLQKWVLSGYQMCQLLIIFVYTHLPNQMIFQHPVAIKPYLKNYLARYCKIDPVLVISNKNRFASYLLVALRHKTVLPGLDSRDYNLDACSEKILVSIPELYERNFGIIIGAKQQYWFNKFIQEDFQDRMLTYVVPKLTGKKNEIKPALMKFREMYNITEDDLPIRTMEKMWERNRERIPIYMQN